MSEIDEEVADDETVLWRGVPDRQLYIAWARLLEHGGRLIAAPLVFVALYFLTGASVVVTLGIVLIIGAIGAAIRDWKIRSATFLGEYAVSDKRVMRVNMRGKFASLPRDSELAYRISRRKTSRTVRFSHKGRTTIRFGCLTKGDIQSLESVLSPRT